MAINSHGGFWAMADLPYFGNFGIGYNMYLARPSHVWVSTTLRLSCGRHSLTARQFC